MSQPFHIFIKKEIRGLEALRSKLEEGAHSEACKCTDAKEVEHHVCDDCEYFDCGSGCSCECSRTTMSDDPDKHAEGCPYPHLERWLNSRIHRLMTILKDAPMEQLTA